MGLENIGPDEARAALARLGNQRTAVARGDYERASLLLLAAGQVVYSLLGVALQGRVDAFWIISGWLFVIAAFGVWREVRQRVYRRANRAVALASIVAGVVLYTALEFGVPPHMSWHRVAPDWHFVAVTGVASVPLLVGAWLVGRKR